MVPPLTSPSVFVVFASSLVLLVNAQDGTGSACPTGQDYAVLDVQVDEHAAETGWSLICDGVTVWDVSVGDLSDQAPGSWIHSEYCPVAITNIYNFTIIDQGQDGFTGDYGYFALKYGAQTIATSDYGTYNPFSQLKYCFGPTCDIPPLENDFVWESPFANKNNTEESGGGDSSEGSDESSGWTATVSVKDPDDETGGNTTTTGNNTNTTSGQDGNDGGSVETNSTGAIDPSSGQSDKSIENSGKGSASTAAIVVSILGVIVVGALAFVQFKRHRQREVVPPALRSNEPVENVGEKPKECLQNVQPSATLITKDSSDNTTVADAV
jgi:hypothetical protein